MGVDHTLDFGSFNDGVKVCYYISDLDYFCFDWLSLELRIVSSVRGLKAFVDAVKEFAEGFGTV